MTKDEYFKTLQGILNFINVRAVASRAEFQQIDDEFSKLAKAAEQFFPPETPPAPPENG